MPDGGFQSVEGTWGDNCRSWATRRMSGSILSPLAHTADKQARPAVVAAETELRRRSGVDLGWRNHQFTLTRGSRNGPVMNMPIDEAPGALQSVCDAITDIYGWQRLVLPTSYAVHEGRWRTGEVPPAGWPASANHHEVVSLAVTSKKQFCWTEPLDLAPVLTHPTKP